MRKFIKVDEHNIVIGACETSNVVDGYEIEIDSSYNIHDIMGMRWNGKTFEEVPQEEVETPRVVTNEDIEEYCLTILDMLVNEELKEVK